MDWPWTPMHGETRYNFVFHFWPTPTTRKKFYALLWVTALISYFTWASLSVAFPLRGPMPISQWTAKNKQPSNSWTSLWTAETNFSQLRGIFFAHTCVMLLFLPKWRSEAQAQYCRFRSLAHIYNFSLVMCCCLRYALIPSACITCYENESSRRRKIRATETKSPERTPRLNCITTFQTWAWQPSPLMKLTIM